MESLKLSAQDQRLYAELFSACDVENTGKVSGLGASELFRTSGLPQEILQQITEQCGAKRLGHFGRSQFYIALKLIALAQCGLPLGYEALNSGIEIPLPKFTRPADQDGWRGQLSHTAFTQHLNEQEYLMSGDRIAAVQPQPQGQQAGHLPPPPGKHPRTYAAGQRIQHPAYDGQPMQTQQPSAGGDTPPQDTRSPPLSPRTNQAQDVAVIQPSQPVPYAGPQSAQYVGAQPAQYAGPQQAQYAGPQSSQYPGPQPVLNNQSMEGIYTNNQHDHPHKIKEGGWASFDEESQDLIPGVAATAGGEEPKSWAQFTDHSKADTSSISSEAESVDDVWVISEEQRDYYCKQFKTMQSDMSGVISGAVAKEFFEKSKLPVHELSKIWQLSDVNKDGALSLEEFCTAMHLVVLRRNDIDLPDHLPPTLMPYVPLVNTDEPFAADLPHGSTLKRLTPTSPEPNLWTTNANVGPVTFPPPESPTSSAVSSPGTTTKPVNFEFKPIIADPESNVVHPVALRMSPDGQPMSGEGLERGRAFSGTPNTNTNNTEPSQYDDQSTPDSITSPTRTRAGTDALVDLAPDSHTVQLPTPLQSRPRPTPKKAQSVPGPTQEVASQARLLPPPQGGTDSSVERPSTLQVQDNGAPPPPPRTKGHSRSSSLDNQLIDLNDEGGGHSGLVPPPAVPPRPSPKDGLPGTKKQLVSQVSEPVFSAIDPSRKNFADFTKFETIPSQEVLHLIAGGHSHVMVGATHDHWDKHKRSVSLDYNAMSGSTFATQYTQALHTEGPDLVSTMPALADAKQSVTPPGGLGRDRLREEISRDETDKGRTVGKAALVRQSSKDKQALQASIRKQRERNTTLSRLNNELNQELQEVMEQRIALEIQLEHLRPFSS